MKDGDACLRADLGVPGISAFTTLRHGAGSSEPPFERFNLGSRCGDDPAAVDRNRRELVERFALPNPPRWLRQVHGTQVVRFDADGTEAQAGAHEEPEADAAVTATPGTVLAILTADCLPVVFAARDGSEVAAAHAGWRGLAAGVLERTLEAMRAPRGDIVAWLGPAAGPASYEIGREVHEAFAAGDASAADAFAATRPGHWRVDLYALARQRLARAGIDEVRGGGLDTIADPGRFFSHRRDQHTGRMATLAWIAPR